MLTVNTNTGAMIALQYLNHTNAQLQTTQNAINTGLKVASAKDDGATFAIAQDMRGDVAGYSAVHDSLNRGMSAVDVGLSAGQSISDLLIEMKQKALSASDSRSTPPAVKPSTRTSRALRDQITSIINNAVFNGFNMVNGSTTQITALASSDGTRKITVSAENMSLSGSIVTIASTASISTQAKAFDDDRHDRSIADQRQQRAGAPVERRRRSSRSRATSSRNCPTPSPPGSAIWSMPIWRRKARILQSLQIKQQLGVQALSIANQAPQIILSLFK